jgi:spore photoproduct lyase
MAIGLSFKRVFFEQDAMDYPLGKKLYSDFKRDGFQIEFLRSHNRVTGIPGKTPSEAFSQGKNTLVVGVRRTLDFASCKPSAHYQIPLVTGCGGMCEYCYLNTQMGKKPYTRIYVNIDDILTRANNYIEERKPEITFFEAAATSDPIAVEPYTGTIAKAIDFFSALEYGRLRLVTKFSFVDSLLELNHKKHTRIRFSINTNSVIKDFEHRTPKLSERLRGLSEVLAHGYPGGVIIAPVILQGEWEKNYTAMLEEMRDEFNHIENIDLHFEVISHRFTRRARKNITEVFPNTKLPMNEETDRRFQYGQFGYGKFVYTKEKIEQMKDFFYNTIHELFPGAVIDYII